VEAKDKYTTKANLRIRIQTGQQISPCFDITWIKCSANGKRNRRPVWKNSI